MPLIATAPRADTVSLAGKFLAVVAVVAVVVNAVLGKLFAGFLPVILVKLVEPFLS